jgi:hypothetical protein
VLERSTRVEKEKKGAGEGRIRKPRRRIMMLVPSPDPVFWPCTAAGHVHKWRWICSWANHRSPTHTSA